MKNRIHLFNLEPGRFSAMLPRVIAAAAFVFIALPVYAQIAPGSHNEKLFRDVWNNDLPGVQASLNAGADIFAKNDYGQTAADIAVDKGYYDIAHYLTQSVDRMQTSPVQSSPVQSSPVQSSPVQPNPVQSNPVQSNLGQMGATLPAIPATGNRVQTSAAVPPVHAAPVIPVVSAVPVAPPSVTPPSEAPPSKVPPSKLPKDTGPFAVTTPPQTSLAKIDGPTPFDPAPPLPAKKTDEAAQSPAPNPDDATPKGTTPDSITPDNATPDDATPDGANRFLGAITSFFKSDKLTPAGSEAPKQKPAQKPGQKPEQQAVLLSTPAPPPPVRAQPPRAASRKNLNDALGLPLGKSYPEQKPKTPESCIAKKKATVCIEQTSWSDNVFQHFDELKSSIFKRFDKGNRAMVGYRDGAAKYVQTIFAASDFASVTEHFTTMYGPPDQRAERIATPFGKPRQTNLELSWYGYDETLKRETVLQIANFDETRGHQVNMAEGSIVLSYVNEPSPYTFVTPIELIRIP